MLGFPACQKSGSIATFRTASLGVIAAASASMSLWAPTARAIVVLNNGDSVSLTSLLAAGSDRKFRVFDKIFTIESFTSNQFMPSQVTVVGFTHPTNPLEVGFDLTGGFGDPTAGDGIVHEFNTQYTVEIAPPFIPLGYRITDNHLIFNGNATGGPGSFARVDETVINPITGAVIGQKSVFDIVNAAGPNSTKLFDELIFGPPGYTILEINKDVKFFAATPGSTASASFVRQSFSQIPTPGASALLILGGVAALRRRR